MSLLPTEKSKRKTDIRDFVTLIYGQRKIGKSTFCSNADGALFISTEPGLNDLDVYKVEVTSWSEFLNVCQEIATGNHNFRTIVIDTIDNLYMLCVDSILKKFNIQHQGDLEYGKGYDLVKTEFLKKLTALSMLPYGLMMISHSTEKEVKTRTGKEYKIVPTLPNSARNIVLGMVDFILYAEVDEIHDDEGAIIGYQHVIRTRPTTIYEAGNRTQNPLPETLPLDYFAFVKAFNESIANRKQTMTGETKEEPKPSTLPQFTAAAGQAKPASSAAPKPMSSTAKPQPMKRLPNNGNSK